MGGNSKKILILSTPIWDSCLFSQFDFICKKEKAKWLPKGAHVLTLLTSVESYYYICQKGVLITDNLIKMPPKLFEIQLF